MNRIKEFRNKKKLTQTELAKEMNVKQNTISDWENRNKMPNIIKAIQLAEILDTTVEELYK
ncbi:MAG: helix-turn-helix domain-containing protein [Clostridia bacterium]